MFFGIDVAFGKEEDHHAIVVMGLSGRIHATYTSNAIDLMDLPQHHRRRSSAPQLIVIEVDGPGRGLISDVRLRSRLPVVGEEAKDAKHHRMQAFGAAISSGRVPIGPELVIEVQFSVIRPPLTPTQAPKYVSRDDLINAGATYFAGSRRPNRRTRHLFGVDFRTHFIPTWQVAQKKKAVGSDVTAGGSSGEDPPRVPKEAPRCTRKSKS